MASPTPTLKARESDATAQRYVAWLIGVFLLVAFALLSMNVATSTKHSVARTALGASFAQVQLRQTEFRSESGRFAQWDELVANGASLASGQTVAASNADASHWFLSLRDEKTGMVCDRIGDLVEGGVQRPPNCRAQP